MKVGDVLICCWGATMTLYDFYKVMGFSDSGKSVFLRQTGKLEPGGDIWKFPVQPNPDQLVGETITRRISREYVAIYKGARQFCNINKPWDGQQTFYENHLD